MGQSSLLGKVPKDKTQTNHVDPLQRWHWSIPFFENPALLGRPGIVSRGRVCHIFILLPIRDQLLCKLPPHLDVAVPAKLFFIEGVVAMVVQLLVENTSSKETIGRIDTIDAGVACPRNHKSLLAYGWRSA